MQAGAAGSRKGRGRQAVYLLLLVTVNLALFLPSMSGDFLWDDKQFISENPYVQGSGFLRTFLFSPFGGFSGLDENSKRQDGEMRFYRPLVSLSYWLDFKTWGLNPAAFHLTNILIHTLNVIVLFYVLIGLALSPRAGFFGALLFSVLSAPLRERVLDLGAHRPAVLPVRRPLGPASSSVSSESGLNFPSWARRRPISWGFCARKTLFSCP